ncbi:MAG: hypothetical protein PVJ11_02680 [Syntrophobacterales bacterium]
MAHSVKRIAKKYFLSTLCAYVHLATIIDPETFLPSPILTIL